MESFQPKEWYRKPPFMVGSVVVVVVVVVAVVVDNGEQEGHTELETRIMRVDDDSKHLIIFPRLDFLYICNGHTHVQNQTL